MTDSVLTTMGPASTGPPPIPANINASLNAIGAAVRSMDGRVGGGIGPALTPCKPMPLILLGLSFHQY